MSQSASDPNANLIYDAYGGIFRPQILRTALLLDVFSPLADGPAEAQVVARACGCASVPGIQLLLDYLVSLQFVERRDDGYALTPTAAAFFVRGRRSYAGDWVLACTDPAYAGSMLDSLRTGEPSHYQVPWEQDAWLESCRPDRKDESLTMWRTAGIAPGQCAGLHVLDLACGCAIKSLSLAQADADVRVTCIDSAEVLAVARDLAGRLGVESRVTLRPGDLLSDDLGKDDYGAALLGQVSYYFTAEQNSSLFRRIHAALEPGGTLIVDAIMTGEQPSEWACLVGFVVHTISAGRTHAFDDYRAWLEGAGFGQVTQHSEKWLSAVKAA